MTIKKNQKYFYQIKNSRIYKTVYKKKKNITKIYSESLILNELL